MEETKMSELKIAKPPIEKVDRTPVVFKNEETGLMLAGIIYRPRNRKEGEKLPAVVIGGPMLSAKELVQSLYGQLLAEQGYLTMVYDNSTIGSSEGHPRGLEDPEMKAGDIRSAVSYLMTVPDVDTDRIAGLGICGSGVYIPHALRNDSRVKAVVSIVPFTVMSFVTTAPDEVLLALTICALTNPMAQVAKEQLSSLNDSEAHFSVIISDEDLKLLKRLGISVTCEPRYEINRLYHK